MSQVPDYFRELPAWRKFAPANNGIALASVASGNAWTNRDLGEALCSNGIAHQSGCPELTCSCGFYCYKVRGDAELHAQGTILARVAVWGRCVEHTRGYRSQHMRIDEIFVPRDYPAIDALKTRYGVPVTIDEGVPTWISVNPNASSSLSPYQNQSFYQNGYQAVTTGIAYHLSSNPSYNPPSSQPVRPQTAQPLSQFLANNASVIGAGIASALSAVPTPVLQPLQPPPHIAAAIQKAHDDLQRLRKTSRFLFPIMFVLLIGIGIMVAAMSHTETLPPIQTHAAPPPKAAPPLPAAIVGVPERPMPAAIEAQDWHLMMVVVDTDDLERRHLVQDALVKIGDVKRFGSTSTWFVSAPRSSVDVRANLQKMVGRGENVYVHDLRKSSGASLCCDTKFWEWIQKNYHNE